MANFIDDSVPVSPSKVDGASDGRGIIPAAQWNDVLQRTVDLRDRLRDREITPLNYGGKGNGTIDDTTALATAATVAAAAGRRLVLPEGYVFRCTSNVTLPAGTFATGRGEIRFDKAAGGALLRVQSNTILDGIVVSGNSKATQDDGISVLSGSSNAVIRNCVIKETGLTGVSVSSGCTNVAIIDNQFTDIGNISFVEPAYNSSYGNGIYSAGSNVLIARNRMRNVQNRGILVVDCSDVTLEANSIISTGYRAIEGFAQNGSASQVIKRLTIRNNYIEATGALRTGTDDTGSNGIAVFRDYNYKFGKEYGDVALQATDVVISGNVLKDIAENGIECNVGIVVNNTIHKSNARGFAVTSPEGLYVGPRSICRGNVIRDCPKGIRLYAGTDYPADTAVLEETEVADNYIVNATDTAIHCQADGLKAGTLRKIAIRGNRISGAPTGITITSNDGGTVTADEIVVAHNDMVGVTTKYNLPASVEAVLKLSKTLFEVGTDAQFGSVGSRPFSVAEEGGGWRLNNSGYIAMQAGSSVFSVDQDGGLTLMSGVKLYTGSANPVGNFGAPLGSLFLRTNGTLYVKQTEVTVGDATGWVAK